LSRQKEHGFFLNFFIAAAAAADFDCLAFSLSVLLLLAPTVVLLRLGPCYLKQEWLVSY